MLERVDRVSKSISRLLAALGLVAAAACGVTDGHELRDGLPEGSALPVSASVTKVASDGEAASRASVRAAFIFARQEAAGLSYAAIRDGEAVALSNKAHRFRSSFVSGDGRLTIESQGGAKAAGASWHAEVALSGYGCGDNLQAVEVGAMKADGNRVVQDFGAVRAWYLNGPLGLEQGFDLPAAPPCLRVDKGAEAVGTVTLAMRVAGLEPSLHRNSALQRDPAPQRNSAPQHEFTLHGDWVSLRDASGVQVLRYTDLYVQNAAGQPLVAKLRVVDSDVFIDVQARSSDFPLMIDPLFTQQSKVSSGQPEAYGNFGNAVDISGDTAIVGAVREGENDHGSAYVFVRVNGSWIEQATLAGSDATPGDEFGYSVKIYGDTAVVGATDKYTFQSGRGAVYVFVRNGTSWTEQAKLTDGLPSSFSPRFGRALSLEGDWLVVGSHRDDEAAADAGAAYVYMRTGNAWGLQSKLFAGDATPSIGFGTAVSLSGDTLVVGSMGDDNGGVPVSRGAVYVFERAADQWVEQARLEPPGSDKFGRTVDLVGDTMVVGEPSGGGVVHVYARNGVNWNEEAELLPNDPASSFLFGTQVHFSGDIIVVGDSGDSEAASSAGAIHVYSRSGTSWTKQAKLIAADASGEARFGSAVATFGDTIVVGADEADGVLVEQGAAYFYTPGLSDGAPCGGAGECLSDHCIDGVCCESACGDGVADDCLVCNAAGAEGSCASKSEGSSCGSSSDELCTNPDSCDAAGNCLLNDEPATTLCRPSAGDCDVEEMCTGAGLCPPDSFAAAATECRPAVGACDVAELCSGTAVACPADAVTPANRSCRVAAGQCDVAEVCDGVAKLCPSDAIRPDGAVCEAGAGVCAAGTCEDAPAVGEGPTASSGCGCQLVSKAPALNHAWLLAMIGLPLALRRLGRRRLWRA